MKNKILQKIKNEKGMALLFAVMMTSALLLVALGISQISYKEGLFSIEARDSARAFLAADTGIECAMYMDANGAFSTSTTSTIPFSCHNINVTVYASSSTQFNFPLPVSPNSCAMMYIDKGIVVGTTTATRIDVYGYNIGQTTDGATNTPNPICVSNMANMKVVNRALEVNYVNP